MTDRDTTIREAREALSRLDKAGEEIGEVAANVRSRWRMSIPANPNRDTDLIVSDACVAGQRSITALLAVIEQQQFTIERFEASNRYGDQMILAQSDVIGELNNDVSDLRATIDRQAETLRQVRELAEDVKGCSEKYGYEKSGWDAAMDQVMIRLDFPDASRILDAGGEA